MKGEKRMYSELTKMEGKRIVIRTFGYFDIFVDGETIPFSCKKAKELLALLVDRRGGFVTTVARESASCSSMPPVKTMASTPPMAAM